MNRNRRRRTDGNHTEVFDAIDLMGYGVESLSDVGRGVPDLLVAVPLDRHFTDWPAVNVLVEVKMPGGERTPAQDRFGERWRGPVLQVTGPEDARQQLQMFREAIIERLDRR